MAAAQVPHQELLPTANADLLSRITRCMNDCVVAQTLVTLFPQAVWLYAEANPHFATQLVRHSTTYMSVTYVALGVALHHFISTTSVHKAAACTLPAGSQGQLREKQVLAHGCTANPTLALCQD